MPALELKLCTRSTLITNHYPIPRSVLKLELPVCFDGDSLRTKKAGNNMDFYRRLLEDCAK